MNRSQAVAAGEWHRRIRLDRGCRERRSRLPLPGNVAEATEQLIKQHNSRWQLDGGNGFHPESMPHLRAAGFHGFETFSYDLDVRYTPEAWRGRIRASAGVGASLEPRNVQAFDAALAQILDESFPGDVLHVSHRVFAVLARLGPR